MVCACLCWMDSVQLLIYCRGVELCVLLCSVVDWEDVGKDKACQEDISKSLTHKNLTSGHVRSGVLFVLVYFA